jgi:spermidine/putrescine transport system substrate-binding protein
MKKRFLIAGVLTAATVISSIGVMGQKRSLSLFIWSEYIDPAIVKAFEKKTGAKVNISLYESMEDMLAKLEQGGTKQYDVIVPSTYAIKTLIGKKLVQPLELAKITNYKNLSKRFKNPNYDPGNKFTVAYQWGTTGIGYRKDKVKNFDKSWSLLFDPKKQQGPFVMLDDMRVMLGGALRYLGYPQNDINLDHLKEAGKLVQEAKTRALGFDGSPGGKNKLLGGQATAAVIYNGEAARGIRDNPNLGYFLPKEGTEIWVDSLMITSGAPNKDLATQFINYILDAKVGAQLSDFNQFGSPNEASKAFMSKADVKNTVIYPDDNEMAKLEFTADIGANLKLYDAVWTKIKAR